LILPGETGLKAMMIDKMVNEFAIVDATDLIIVEV